MSPLNSRPGAPQSPDILGIDDRASRPRVQALGVRLPDEVEGEVVRRGDIRPVADAGHPFSIGGLQTPALRSHSNWVTNITLRYFFF
jgi:hypothetical protein